MNKMKRFLFVICCVVVILGCSSKQRFPVDKRFWTPEDYQTVIFEIQYQTPKDELYPKFSDPENAVVIQKLVDAQNYLVVADDKELGLNYKNEVTKEFFHKYRDLYDTYKGMDVQDKYIYPEELIAVEKFGLGLQIYYFKLGNDRIAEQADAADSTDTKRVLTTNRQTIIGNFNLYLDNVKDEKRFGAYAPSLAEGITTHFFKLIETFPDANYGEMLAKAKGMSAKTQVPEIKTALEGLVSKIESMKKPV